MKSEAVRRRRGPAKPEPCDFCHAIIPGGDRCCCSKSMELRVQRLEAAMDRWRAGMEWRAKVCSGICILVFLIFLILLWRIL